MGNSHSATSSSSHSSSPSHSAQHSAAPSPQTPRKASATPSSARRSSARAAVMKNRTSKLPTGDALFNACRATLAGTTPAAVPASLPLTAPAQTLALRHAAGYRIRDARGNLYFTDDHATHIVYPAAALGIVQDLAATKIGDKQPTIFKSHTDDVISLAYHAGRGLVASGQMGLEPTVYVWKTTGEIVAKIVLEKGSVGVGALAFTPSGSHLLVIAQDNEHVVSLFSLTGTSTTPPRTATVRGGTNVIVDAVFSTETEFMTIGGKQARFWTVEGSTINSRNGLLDGKAEVQNITSVAYVPSDHVFVTGTATGDVLVWENGKVVVNHKDAHGTAPVFAVTALPAGSGFASGGKSGGVQRWTAGGATSKKDGAMIQCGDSGAVRSLDAAGHKLAVGLDDGAVLTYCLQHHRLAEHSHSHSCIKDAELWGLAIVDAAHIVTAGDDAQCLLWDLATGSVIARAKLAAGARTVAANAARGIVAVGLSTGAIEFLSLPKLTPIGAPVPIAKQAVSAVAFSPTDKGSRLAVGSHDSTVYVLSAPGSSTSHDYKLTGTNEAHTSFITSLDWSVDGSLIQSNSGDFELLFTQVDPTTGAATHQTELAGPREAHWATYSATIGWATKGIWDHGQDGLDINAVARWQPSAGGAQASEVAEGLLVIGNDSSKVELLRYPAAGVGRGSTARHSYGGHASHVTNVRFSLDGKWAISTGGADGCVLFWAVVAA
ncbi:WD40-repeat-containing domain protein [Blastocladiella britannica]|nr:WD40-repeat-containing domain protein [Blastocladiella britannica]